MRGEYLRQPANYDVREEVVLARDSQVGCSDWLAAALRLRLVALKNHPHLVEVTLLERTLPHPKV